MSYSIDLEHARLLCRTEARAIAGANLINGHPWMSTRMQVSPTKTDLPPGAPQWQLFVDRFDGGKWSEDQARDVWLALLPLLTDRSALEFRTEQGERFRFRWEHGRIHEDEPVMTIWREYSLLGPFSRLEEPEVLAAPPSGRSSKRTPGQPKKNSGTRQKR